MSTRGLVFYALVAASIAAGASTIMAVAQRAMSSAEYSHIALVLPVSFALIYLERRAIFSGVEFRIVTGTVIMALITAAWLSQHRLAAATPDIALFISALILVSFWIAAFWTCFGPPAARQALFPLLFLFLLAPLPDYFMTKAVAGLQWASAETVDVLFRLSGVPVLRKGQVFIFVTQQIEVAKECSGIRSSIALLVTSLIFGHLFLRWNWAKCLLVAAVVPLAIFKNGLRIFTLSLLGTYVDPGFLNGPLHHRGGIVFFAVTLSLLALILWGLRRLEQRKLGSLPIREGLKWG